VEVFEYARLTPLQQQEEALMGYRHLQAGDCVIAFSRRSCYELKQRIEQLHKGRHKCCVVYGGLPPGARKEQARLFNSQNSGFDILVATDAVGMGLNLSIGRIIFSSMEKFDGTKSRSLRPDEIKQIAGRAGRYQSIYPNGTVACLRAEDMRTLKRGLQVRDKRIPSAGLFPSVDELRTIEGMTWRRA
jgi:ATP-dependent RNA helicase SUPV3L1/SUV3